MGEYCHPCVTWCKKCFGHVINLESEITTKNDNIMTTSCALVLIKTGRLIMLATKCISAPTVADTCRTIK